MLPVVRLTVRLVVGRWPVLLAWFLLGWSVHFVTLRAAAVVAVDEPTLGLLVLPLAVLARLISYIGMFLAVRAMLPAYAEARRRGGESAGARGRGSESGGAALISAAILPFFVFYAAWGLLREDFVEYSLEALSRVDWLAGPEVLGPLELRRGPLLLAVVALAYGARLAIKQLASRGARWVGVPAAYMEAVWVFIVVFAVSAAADELGAWLGSRRFAVGMDQHLGAVLERVGLLRAVWEGVTAATAWILGHADIVALPVAWLAIAGVVYGRALDDRPPPRARLAVAAGRRWRRLPQVVRLNVADVSEDFRSRWTPVADAFRLMHHAGPAPMSVFVLAYTLVTVAPDWLFTAIARLIGPHPLPWWSAMSEPLDLAVEIVAAPLLICVVAAAYDYCLAVPDTPAAGEDRLTAAD